MPALAFLDVTRNQMATADGGAGAGDARRRLARLTTLYAYNNRFGSAGVSALVEGLCGAAPPALEKLYLDNNAVRDDGVDVLARAIEGGRLPALKVLHGRNRRRARCRGGGGHDRRPARRRSDERPRAAAGGRGTCGVRCCVN